MTNLSRLVAASFSSLALLSSSVSMVNLSCLLATTFSSLSFLSYSFSSPRYNLLRMAKCWFLWSSVSFSRLILSLSFLCSSVSETLFALSFLFLSERFSSVHAKVEMNNTGVTGRIVPPNTDFEHARVWATFFCLRFLAHDRHYICNSYTMGSRSISEEMPVSRGCSPSARVFIPIYPISNYGISILYPD